MNAIFPLILNSLERLYQPKIDGMVKGLAHLTKFLILGLLQLIVIVFFAPTILLVIMFEHIYPRIFEFERVKRSGIKQTMHTVMSKEFWSTMGRGFRIWKRRLTAPPHTKLPS
jgi:hypothetical protein